MIKIIGETGSLFTTFLAEIRDEEVQKDSMRFRRNLERAGEIFAYEISKTLNYKEKEVQTPLGIAQVPMLTDNILLATIMRAGLPMQQGLLNYFDKAESAFISAYRKYHSDGKFDIKFEHLSCPAIDDKIVIISDPMLATGSSMALSYKALMKRGTPVHTHIISLIASKEGIDFIKKQLPTDKITLWVGAVDDELTVKSYIVPGLGDAGDLAFGSKE